MLTVKNVINVLWVMFGIRKAKDVLGVIVILMVLFLPTAMIQGFVIAIKLETGLEDSFAASVCWDIMVLTREG